MEAKKDIFLKKKFLVITHTYATGPSQELRDYFIKKRVSFTFLEHPFSIDKNLDRSTITYYEKGKEKIKIIGGKVTRLDWICFIKDFSNTLYLVIKLKKKFDICVAADNLNAFAGFFLKKIGFVKKLIYYAIDYSPKRFESPLLNSIYLQVDKFCCCKTDLVWSSSGRMKGARIASGVKEEKHSPELVVRDGCHFKNIKRAPISKIDFRRMVFMGHLVPNKGVELIIESLPLVLKQIPKVKLLIIGGGSEEKKLKDFSKKMKLGNKVIFTGFVKDHAEIERMIAEGGVAVAPYVPDPSSFTYFSDVGKVKVYLACGLPVLLTNVPEIAKEIEKNKAGMIIRYDPKDLADKVVRILEDKNRYSQFRNNAVKMAKSLDWDNVWSHALSKSFAIIHDQN